MTRSPQRPLPASVLVPPAAAGWSAWLQAARRLDRRFAGHFVPMAFDYRQAPALQPEVPRRLRRPYTVRVGYTDWGSPERVPLVCCGGVANTAMRFAFLAADLWREGQRVVCMDWLGRGQSGWLADGSEYTRDTYVEQLRQLIEHLGRGPVPVLGSSLGGSVALALAARHPQLVSALVLNDVGPHIPQARRARRAETLARHYVFRTPEEMTRRAGAAQKHDGPVGEEVRLFIAYHQTRWSAEDGGRVYRHDPRALLAYQRDAARSVDLWDAWSALRCPVLLVHGLESDALTPATIARMQRSHPITLAHIPDTGHTPVLADRHQTALIAAWLRGELPGPRELSVPHAPTRRAWAAPG
ncbi:MAG: alpha/beta fold hydrolase [Burkholderiales bacterium]|nr:alpha/beta fold hydrolase [Burkholderiales bacterium]